MIVVQSVRSADPAFHRLPGLAVFVVPGFEAAKSLVFDTIKPSRNGLTAKAPFTSRCVANERATTGPSQELPSVGVFHINFHYQP